MVVVIAVVVVIIPIAFRAPPALVFIPPSVTGTPAVLPRLVQLMARALRLSALVAIPCDRSIEPVVRAGNTALAVVGAHKWRRREH